jgi:Family of unknown function (DUF6084)
VSELGFSVTEIVPERYAASPMLSARIHVTEATGAVVHAMALRCQVRIEPQRRRYDEAVEGLSDLFGGRERWATTLKSLLWMHTSTMVQGFSDAIDIELPLPCSYDFDVAATKYLHAIGSGEIPLSFLFNGTVFTRGATGFEVEQIPWHTDIEFRMPAATWRDAIDLFFPNAGWIRADRSSIAALDRFRTDHGLTGWEETISALLSAADASGEDLSRCAPTPLATSDGVLP